MNFEAILSNLKYKYPKFEICALSENEINLTVYIQIIRIIYWAKKEIIIL